MGGWGNITFADIARALGRYRPVAFTILAVLLLLAVLPNHNRPTVSTESAAAVKPGGGALRTTPTAPAAGTEVAGASADSAALGGGSIGTGTIGSGAIGSSTYDSSSSSYSSSTTTPSTYSYAPQSSGSSPSDSDTFGGSTDGSDGSALTVTAAAWATNAGSGTPLATAGVPDGDLPVGTRLNSDDKRSFVRLAGGATVLTLKADSAGARAPVSGDALISACQITAGGWQEAAGSTFDAAPKYDSGKCVPGKASADGSTWTFDLSSFATRTDNRGFALVPTPGAAVDFQVAFTR